MIKHCFGTIIKHMDYADVLFSSVIINRFTVFLLTLNVL